MRRAREEPRQSQGQGRGRQRKVAKLAASPVYISARAGEGGRLFGSVTKTDIARAIEDQLEEDVDRHDIRLEEPIRSLGSYSVEVHLHEEVNALVTVEVIAHEEEAESLAASCLAHEPPVISGDPRRFLRRASADVSQGSLVPLTCQPGIAAVSVSRTYPRPGDTIGPLDRARPSSPGGREARTRVVSAPSRYDRIHVRLS